MPEHSEDTGKVVSRRGFWRAAGGVALAALAGYLGLREGSPESPHIHAPCRRCGALSSCAYPEARRTRAALAQREDVGLARGSADCPYGKA